MSLLSLHLPNSFFLFVCLFVFFAISWAASVAYGGSQARGLIGAVAASLRQSHSNAGSELCLQPTPQLTASQIFNPLSKARDRTRNLMVPSRIHFCWATMGTPVKLLISPSNLNEGLAG